MTAGSHVLACEKPAGHLRWPGIHVGVMQGRLLPKYMGRYQAYPKGYWEKEFELAASFGLSHIEWILDWNDHAENALMTPVGRREIKAKMDDAGVCVVSVCADFFMECPLHSGDASVQRQAITVLGQTLEAASDLGAYLVVIPCVDQSSVAGDAAAQARLINVLSQVLEARDCSDVNISLEMDLPPAEFAEVLHGLPSEGVGVNYDIGNSAALGFDFKEEFKVYGDRINLVHIKDRALGGGPVVLGQGDAKLAEVFEGLRQLGYDGPYTMQAYRDDEGLEVFSRQMDVLEGIINAG